MMALARAANIELRIWARRENLPWQLYELRGSQKPTGVVWLVLENYHYRLLRLKTKKQPPQTLRKEAIVLSDGPIKQEGKWQRFAPSSQAQEAKTNPALKRPAEAAEEPDNKRPAAKTEKKDTLTGAGYTKILEGGGGSRCGSVRSQAVSTARSSVPDSARVRKLLGLGSAAPSEWSATVRRLLGLGSAARSEPAVSDEEPAGEPEYVNGQYLRCPCGWMPSPGLKSAAQRTQANRHWRDCEGKEPPAATEVQRKQARTARCRVQQPLEKAQAERRPEMPARCCQF